MHTRPFNENVCPTAVQPAGFVALTFSVKAFRRTDFLADAALPAVLKPLHSETGE
jgi:hypothetical protein